MLDSILIAVAAIVASIAGTMAAHWLDRKRRREDEARQVEAVLWGVHSEIVEIRDHYFHAIGNEIEKDPMYNTPLGKYMRAEQPYFSVYESTVDSLSRVDDPALLRSIVRTYMIAKRVIDSHRVQGDIIEAGNSGDRNWQAKATEHKPELVQLHDEFKRTAERTLDLLVKRHGPLNPDGTDNEAPPGYFPQKADAPR